METWLVVEVDYSERNGYLTWKNQIDNLLSLLFTLTQSMINSNKHRLTDIFYSVMDKVNVCYKKIVNS